MNESEFLALYDANEFDSPLVTVDSVLFTCHEDHLKVLLVKRSNHPCLGFWGLPGGFVDMEKDQSLEDTAIRKLYEKTGVTPPYIEPLICKGNATRDKRGWAVTACYTALIAYQNCHIHVDSVSDVKWFAYKELDTLALAFDHKDLIHQAHERLRQKALYSIVPAYALPDKFTLPELQRVHELILDSALQKKSFRRRIEQAELLIDTGEKRASGKRQAVLYRMKEASGNYRFVRNLEQ